MDKKKYLKKVIIPGIIIIMVAIICFCTIINIQNKKYKELVNYTISELVGKIVENYPETDEEEIIRTLQDSNSPKNNILKKYGYNEQSTYIKNLESAMKNNMKLNILFICVFGAGTVAIVLVFYKKQNKKINDINNYISRVNNGDYKLDIEDNDEDELTKLRNELYKTTILLKETAENSEKEKIDLSNSLADISHQIKTPITSIRIMLDNIIDNPEMDEDTKADFIAEISKQVDWISSLTISLLKLAKFDAGAIVMNDTDVIVKELIDEVIGNLAVMLELKNINVKESISENIKLKVDYKWQLEAITNIVKNAIEHSNENSKIYISAESNSLFTRIKIKDEGIGINPDDIKHIFERFYKSKGASENSMGIGLSLAKAIIEKDNGYIIVDSELGKGTTFEIKYIK